MELTNFEALQGGQQRAQGVNCIRLLCGLSGFLRRTDDMIIELPNTDRVHSVFRNVVDVRTLGMDGGLRWQAPGEWLELQGNATWQDQRNMPDAGPFRPFSGQRLSNRPWLFADASATVRVARLGAENATLSFRWSAAACVSFSRVGTIRVRPTQPGAASWSGIRRPCC